MYCMLACALLFLWLQTTAGKKIIGDALKNVFSPYVVSVDSIKGFFPFHITVDSLVIYEKDKKLIECQNLDLAWSPLSFVEEALTINHLFFNTIKLHALPNMSSQPSDSKPFWTDYALKAFKIDTLIINDTILEMPLALSIEGNAHLKGDKIGGTFKLRNAPNEATLTPLSLPLLKSACLEIGLGATRQEPSLTLTVLNPKPLLKAHIQTKDDYKKIIYTMTTVDKGISLKELVTNFIDSGTLTLDAKGIYDVKSNHGSSAIKAHIHNLSVPQHALNPLLKAPLTFKTSLVMDNTTFQLKDTQLHSDHLHLNLNAIKKEDALKASGTLKTAPLTFLSHKVFLKHGKFDYHKQQDHHLSLAAEAEIDGHPLLMTVKAMYDTSDMLKIESLESKSQGAEFKGTLRVALGKGDITGHATLNVADLSRMERWINFPIKGSTLLKLTIQGAINTPEIKGSLTCLNLKTTTPVNISLPSLKTDCHFKDQTLQFSSVAHHTDAGVIKAEGHIPFNFSLHPFHATVLKHQPLKARVDGDIDLASPFFIQFLDEDLLKGKAILNIQVGGTLSHPLYEGEVSLKDGYFESLLYGTVLKNVTMLVEGTGDTVVIKNLSAKDAHRGSLTLKGKISDLLNTPNVTLDLNGTNFKAIHTDDLESTVNANLNLRGALSGLALSGTVDLQKTEVKVPETFEESIPTIDIVNPLDEEKQKPPSFDAPTHPPNLVLDTLQVQSKEPIFIRGRGLNSEWKADLKLKGALHKLQAQGGIVLRRGTFDLIGKTLVLNEGSIHFPSSLLKPYFNVKGQHKKDSLTIGLQLIGTPDKFDIQLNSDPAMSQKEILSYFIFGKSDGELTLGQALQLANALSTLKGGNSLDVFGKVRAVLGLDSLNFKSGGSSSLQESTLNVGKNLADGVYVSIDQGLNPEDTKAIIEIDVTPSIILETEVSPSSSGSVGVKYKWDY